MYIIYIDTLGIYKVQNNQFKYYDINFLWIYQRTVNTAVYNIKHVVY